MSEPLSRERIEMRVMSVGCSDSDARWLLDRVAELEKERDELREALADELAEWNPEDRPTLAAQLRTAEAGLAAAQEALKRIANPPEVLHGYANELVRIARDALARGSVSDA